jgi:hypothetical protein
MLIIDHMPQWTASMKEDTIERLCRNGISYMGSDSISTQPRAENTRQRRWERDSADSSPKRTSNRIPREEIGEEADLANNRAKQAVHTRIEIERLEEQKIGSR